MVAVITGDIIGSGNHSSSTWLPILKKHLSKLGKSPHDWEVYRGDEFQLKITAKEALVQAIYIKALLKTIKGLDARIGVGLGGEDYQGQGVSESNGTAYQRSGRTFEHLKEDKINLSIATGNKNHDRIFNLMLKFALHIMDDWSPVSAEIVVLALDYPDASQQEIANRLGIQQSAVSQRQKRARLDLVLELLEFYRENLKEVN
ncbi:SatD family protein [Euzebyella saccharophila]|uniref:SatD family protein n=1 Tax=Euzebyella saccharophila TaxID=679664 RepID=A0ABV8JW66_9FLAO|nr:SatD family protein [Euzebyella saccharophila]